MNRLQVMGDGDRPREVTAYNEGCVLTTEMDREYNDM